MSRMISSLSVLLLLLLTPGLAEAQKNCSKGKPCGKTCIARNKTCRVGTPAASRTSGQGVTNAATAVPEGMHFVASSRGSVYYWTGCRNWRTLRSSLRWFATREAAESAGLRSSASPACRGPADPRALAEATGTAPTGLVDAESPCVVGTVIDGDTLDCADGRRVRLLLIDAPEMDQGSFGPLAKQALEGLAPAGTTLQVETDVELQDRYGRLLAYLRLEDGRLLNEEMLRHGVAVVSVHPPNVRHVDRFRATSESARAAGAGLWSLNAFECLPADHRAGRCGG